MKDCVKQLNKLKVRGSMELDLVKGSWAKWIKERDLLVGKRCYSMNKYGKRYFVVFQCWGIGVGGQCAMEHGGGMQMRVYYGELVVDGCKNVDRGFGDHVHRNQDEMHFLVIVDESGNGTQLD